MKLAIPVKMNKENSAIAPLFGKAKWFAIVENGQVEIVENSVSGGQAVIDWLYRMNVDAILMQEMGRTPYEKIKAYETLAVYHTGFERILLTDVLEKFNSGELPLIDDTNVEEIIKHHEKRHPAHGHA